MNCELCKAEKITQWLYEGELCWVAFCKSHPNKLIMVLKRHTPHPTQKELHYMKQVIARRFPNNHWRGPHSILDHFHLHEV